MARFYFTVTLQLILLFQLAAWGQLHTYLGFQIAVNKDQSRVQGDTGSYLNSNFSLLPNSGLWGIILRRDIHSKLFVQTGITSKEFIQSISFKQANYFQTYSFYYLQVPLGVGYKLRLNNRLSLVPQPGITIGINITPYTNKSGGATNTVNGSKINFYERNIHPARFFILVNPSLALEIKFFDSLLLSVFVGRSWGLTKVSQLDIDYTIDNSPTYSGSVVNNGSFFYKGASLKYPISKFWKKHE